ncbi:hypothetical protein L7F22_009465 [Adiantum nelumboides]|nr:hypothetical protein [Adiantum nelumboides]
MGDQEAKGDEYEKKAEKKLKGWGILGSKYDDAAELFEKAGNCYKLAKSWDKAANSYIQLANCHIKLESKHEAASAFVDAAVCYKKFDSKEAIKYMNLAVQMYMEIGRLSMAAKYFKEIAETYEKEEALAEAIDFYEKAAELYDGEESTSQGNQCKLKVAQFAAVLEQYEKAVEIFESVASHSMNNNLTRYSVKGYLLNAGLCRLVGCDSIAISNALEKYQEMDPSFSNSRECKLLSDLAASIEEEDVDKFTDAVKEFDNMTRLDQWKTTILLKAKNALKELAHQEDFT